MAVAAALVGENRHQAREALDHRLPEPAIHRQRVGQGDAVLAVAVERVDDARAVARHRHVKSRAWSGFGPCCQISLLHANFEPRRSSLSREGREKVRAAIE